MEKNFNIHIFSLTPILCDLIMKSVSHNRFNFQCTYIPEYLNSIADSSILDKLNIAPDCIILDKDINTILKEAIIDKFNKSNFICLPSLNETEIGFSKAVQQMSEPLKISELDVELNKIYLKKNS